MEQQYRTERMPVIRRYFLKLAALFSAVYLLYLLPDYFLVRDIDGFTRTALARVLTITVLLAVYYMTGRLKDYASYDRLLVIFETVYAFSYIFILSQEQSPNFYIKVFDVTMAVLAIFAIPSVWLSSACTALLNIIVFLVYASFTMKNIPPHTYTSIAIYIFLVYVLSCFTAFKTAASRRTEFHNRLQLRHLLDTDTLTGLYSRSRFDTELRRLTEDTRQSGRDLIFCIFDIDNFKSVNDNYGHLAGDNVLRGLASAVLEYKRPQDVAARWGGEEFIIILPDFDVKSARDYMNDFRVRLASLRFAGGISVTCSFGVTLMRPDDTAESVVKRADHLMYKAKQMGKNAVAADDTPASDGQTSLY